MEGKVIKNKMVQIWEMCKKFVMNCTEEQEIKSLVIDKNMSTKDAKEYLNKNKNTLITKRETDLIENNSLINEISKMLTIQNRKLETLIDSQSKILKSQEDIKEFINNKINEIIVNANKLHEQKKEHDIDLVNRLQILTSDDKIKKGNKSIDTTEDVIVGEISVTNTIYTKKPKEKQKINIDDILDDDEFWKDIF